MAYFIRFFTLLLHIFYFTYTSSADEVAIFAPDAIQKPMQFINAYSGGNCLGCEWVAAEGIITADTPQAFSNFMKDNPTNSLIINSTGGNLKAALKLGELIRLRQMDTSIGKTWVNKDSDSYKNGFNFHDVQQGQCFGACTYAFLGGINRFTDGGKFAVTQHNAENFNLKTTQELGWTINQMLHGILLEYTARMGGKSNLVLASSRLNNGKNRILSKQELQNWNVDNATDLFSPATIMPFGKSGTVLETKHIAGYYATPDNPKIYRLYCRGDDKQLQFTILQNHAQNTEKQADKWANVLDYIKTATLTFNQGDFISIPVRVSTYHNDDKVKAIAFELLELTAEKFTDIKNINITLDNIPRENWLEIYQLNADFGKSNRLLNLALQHCIH